MSTTVISSAGTNGLCQQTANVGPFSGDKVICSDGSQHHYCYVIESERKSTIHNLIIKFRFANTGRWRRTNELFQCRMGQVVRYWSGLFWWQQRQLSGVDQARHLRPRPWLPRLDRRCYWSETNRHDNDYNYNHPKSEFIQLRWKTKRQLPESSLCLLEDILHVL